MKIQKVRTYAQLPTYCSAQAAGADLYACLTEPVTIGVGQRDIIPTGIAIELPYGCEGQIRPRSGLALEYGLTVLNSPGTVDSDYRGEIKVLMINLGESPVIIHHHMRIAQLVISCVERATFKEVDELFQTSRGSGGFGSTGV